MARTFFNKNNLRYSSEGRPQITFKLFGQWDETIRVIQKLNPTLKIVSLAAQVFICNDIARRVKAHLRNQDLQWQPLHEDYLKRKKRAGFSGKMLLATKTYYQNIEVWVVGNQHFAFVGVRRGVYTYEISGKRSRLDVASIAALHEFSTGKRLPKRPLWNPTIAEIGGATGIKAMYVAQLLKGLKSKGIPVKPIKSYLNGFK